MFNSFNQLKVGILNIFRKVFIIEFILLCVSCLCHAETVYQEQEVFISEAFSGQQAFRNKLWINKELQTSIRKILGRDLGFLRLRYWGAGNRTVWILEEIGKQQPITVGFVVNDSKIEQVKVLIFRESRGGEIRYPFFTDQFNGASLENNNELSHRIDGISGATLSVKAVERLAKLALLLHQHSKFAKSE